MRVYYVFHGRGGTAVKSNGQHVGISGMREGGGGGGSVKVTRCLQEGRQGDS